MENYLTLGKSIFHTSVFFPISEGIKQRVFTIHPSSNVFLKQISQVLYWGTYATNLL